uniref:Uncharacterized protein n=2 Tax=Myripristis murdjan TaxID=586833 RepID=A0A667WIQ7_9TELE
MHQNWVQLFSHAIQVLSAEDNSSTEVKGHSEHPGSKTQPTHTSTGTAFKWRVNTAHNGTMSVLVEAHADSSDSSDTSDTSDSTDTSDLTGVTDTASESSESTSLESNETSETSDSSDSSQSSESNASDSADVEQLTAKDCLHGADSTGCESEEHFFQGIGDDAHPSVDQLMVPDEAERELSLRR